MSANKYIPHWKRFALNSSGTSKSLRSYARHFLLSSLSIMSRSSEDTFLRCIFCHYVFDDQTQQFERVLISLMKLGEFVNTNNCVQMLRGDKPIDRRYFHLSFDDGYRNNYTNAFPILKKHKVPCIFFIPTGLIQPLSQLDKASTTGPTQSEPLVEMLNWDDVKRMHQAGYEIGSHTKMHARLAELAGNIRALNSEISDSKIAIEKYLDDECKYISWPFGALRDINSESLEVIRGAGYRACFGAFRGSVVPHQTDAFCIPRHHFEVQWPMSHIKYFASGHMERIKQNL